MEKAKEIKLRNFYKEIPEQQLLDMLSEDEKGFEDRAYSLLVEEARRRGLEDKLNEIKIKKEESIVNENQPTYKFIRIFTTPKIEEISVIRSLLDGEKLLYYIKGENFGTLYGPADGLSSADVMIREDYVADAKELLKDFISPEPLKENNEKEKQSFTPRKPGVIIFGWLIILVSAFLVLPSLCFFGIAIADQTIILRFLQKKGVGIRDFYLMSAMSMALYVPFLTSGIAILKLKEWGRKLMLFALCGIFLYSAYYVLKMNRMPPFYEYLFYAFYLALAIYFTRSKVKEQFK